MTGTRTRERAAISLTSNSTALTSGDAKSPGERIFAEVRSIDPAAGGGSTAKPVVGKKKANAKATLIFATLALFSCGSIELDFVEQDKRENCLFERAGGSITATLLMTTH